eukprot:TRINITY_DN19811_c0_g1_i1.p1 TRINITY_DN19811_c0_g1~~TRINITY_DN19811_c0_g1_i1.p1  ORF type:complete len:997 (+),score=202.44 TRINITY_DN19811_c0_g1_i1:64-3054(+)
MDSSPVAAGRRRRLRRTVCEDSEEEADLQTQTLQKSFHAVSDSVPEPAVSRVGVDDKAKSAQTSKRLQRAHSESLETIGAEKELQEHTSGDSRRTDQATGQVPEVQPALSKPVRRQLPRRAAAQSSATRHFCEEEPSTENDNDNEESVLSTPASLLRRPRRARRHLQQDPELQSSKSYRQPPPDTSATRCFLEEEPSDESGDEDVQFGFSAQEQLAAPRRSQRLRARSNTTPASLTEDADSNPNPLKRPRGGKKLACQSQHKQASVTAAPTSSFFADSDAEESSGEGAKALSHSIKASRGGVETRARKRLAVALGTDEDPEVQAWSQDLEDRWMNSSEPRPTAAFSMEAQGLEVLRRLSSANYLAGCPVFDDDGKVNIPWLLGAHKQLLTELHAGGGDNTKTRSPQARQVGWLARMALSLGLIDDAQLRNGRLGRSKQVTQPVAKRSKSCPDFLVAETEIRFPSRPGTTRSKTSDLDEGGDEAAEEDDIERFVKRRQAMAALKSRNEGRQAQIGARSSSHVNMQDVTGKILAPGFSFDWNAKNDGESEDESGDGLEVALPKAESSSTSRRKLLKEQLQKKVRMVMAKGLTTNENVPAATPAVAAARGQEVRVELGSAPATMPAAPTSTSQSIQEELELEVDDAPSDLQLDQDDVVDEDEDQPLERRRRRHRGLVVDEEGDENAESAIPTHQQIESGVANLPSESLSHATPALAVPKQRKQVRLDEMFSAKRVKAQTEEARTDASVAGVTPQDKLCKTQTEEAQMDSSVADVAPQDKHEDTCPEADVAVCPRPLKRLRPGNFTEIVSELSVDTDNRITAPSEENVETEQTVGRMDKYLDSCLESNQLDEASGAEHSAASEEDGSDAEELELFDERTSDYDPQPRRRNLLHRKRLEVASAQRRLRWEVDDAADFQNRNDLITHLGTSTMSSSDRVRWEKEMMHASSSSVTTKSPGLQSSDKRMIWARGDDDVQQLYGLGMQTRRRSSFLGKTHSPKAA